ncbi:MAG: tetratricopeptide repeat protein [Deltaproteobacteria bacterium]|nr:tetratricopeptide repeat protein [Deltaproteobacteria bacterium]
MNRPSPCPDDNQLLAYIEGALCPDEAADVEGHVDGCPACRLLLAELARSQLPLMDGESAPESTQLSESVSAGDALLVLERGCEVGRFVILDFLGAGGMGVVYAAYDPSLDRKVALKFLRSGRAAPAEEDAYRARLMREAQALARISHPHVLAVYDVGLFRDRIFVAMEYVEGGTLRSWLEEPRSWREIVERFFQAGRGLAAVHAAGLVHRDFKASNVLVSKDGLVKVTDFGLARPSADLQGESGKAKTASLPREEGASARAPALYTPMTHTGEFLGTPVYMAPELIEGRAADARSDQYAFCVALYEGLYGQRPFAGKNLEELSARILEGRIDPPPAGKRVPSWLQQLLQRGMRLKPDERYPSMESLLDRLESHPGRRRRRWLATSLVLAVLLAFSLLWLILRPGAERTPCGKSAQNLAGIWDVERKLDVQRAFLKTGQPFAQESFRAVERTLDYYTRDWVRMHTQACEATWVRGEQSHALLDLRMQCLNRRLAELSALVDLFSQADAQVVGQSAQASTKLTGLTGCADFQLLTAQVSPPEEPGLRARVERLSAKLARTKSLLDAGKYAQGLELAVPAAETARTLAYRPIEAEALYLRGRLQSKLGQLDSAEESLQAALWAAIAGKHAELAAEAGIKLIHVAGFQKGSRERGQHWSEYSASALESLGENPKLQSEYHKTIGNLALLQGRYAEALDAYGRAIQTSERSQRPDSMLIADCTNNIGNAFLAQGRYEQALESYERARTMWQAMLGAEHPVMASAMTNVALVLQAQGEHGRALEGFEKALAINRRVFGSAHPDVAANHNNIATVLLDLGRYDRALEFFSRSLALHRELLGPEHPQVATISSNIGELWLLKGNPARALEACREARAILEKANPEHAFLTDVLCCIGQALIGTKAPSQALAPLERALAIGEAHGIRPIVLANTRYALARALWDSGRDRDRARSLAQLAREGYASAMPRNQSREEEVKAWLERHAVR